MKVKEYLSKAYRIDQRVGSKLEQLASLRDLSRKATATLTDMPHNPGRNVRAMEGIIAKIMDLENEINQDIDKLVDLKREIVSAVKLTNNPVHQTLLELRYLGFRSWEQIAVEMGYSLQHVYRLHERALKSVSFSKDESKCDRMRV